MKLMLVLMQPPGAMAETLCDHTCELAQALPHVESARVLRRQIAPDGGITCVQHWRARASVPQLLRPHLEDGLLDWTLTLQRAQGGRTCRWHAESAAVQVPGRCRGVLDFHAAVGGRGTRIEMRFDFDATHEGMRSIFGTLLAQHWRSLAEAAARRAAATGPTAG